MVSKKISCCAFNLYQRERDAYRTRITAKLNMQFSLGCNTNLTSPSVPLLSKERDVRSCQGEVFGVLDSTEKRYMQFLFAL